MPGKSIPSGSTSRPACSMATNRTPISWVHQAGDPLLVGSPRAQHGFGFTDSRRHFQSQVSGVRKALQRVQDRSVLRDKEERQPFHKEIFYVHRTETPFPYGLRSNDQHLFPGMGSSLPCCASADCVESVCRLRERS